jgi:cephalosporin-C deacetylase-like acetyl esterase
MKIRHALLIGGIIALSLSGGSALLNGAEPGPQATEAADSGRMLAPPLEWFDQWHERTGEAVPDFGAMRSRADLPPLLELENGTPVENQAQWQQRREELRELLLHWILGSIPRAIPPLVETEVVAENPMEGAISKTVKLTYRTDTPTAQQVSITCEMIIPNGPGPFPLFMTQTNHRRVALIGLARGYAVCIYPGADIDDQSDKFAKAYPDADWGRLTRRAWLASRVLDYLVTVPQINSQQVAITGHSRNGKQSLIAAALDDRFTSVVSSSSGTGGSTPFRFVGEDAFEESVEFMSRQRGTADWFHPRIRFFTGREDKLPTDIHALLALIAPRDCLLSSAINDGVGTTFSTERNYLACREVYRFLGHPDALRIRWRAGDHPWNTQDAEAYFDWYDRSFERGTFDFPEELIHQFEFDAWRSRQSEDALQAPNAADDPRERVLWSLGDAPPRGRDDAGGSYGSEPDYEAQMMGRQSVPGDVAKLEVNFGGYLRGDLYYPRQAKGPLPVVVWLHPYSYPTGYTGAYVLGPRVYHHLAQQGVAVFAFDQIGFGRRLMEGRDFDARYPRWSRLGKMVADVHAAVDFLCGSDQHHAPGKDAVKVPRLDRQKIYCLGYSMGGIVGLYATALDDRIAGVASFSGFTPLRTDTDDKPTGGIRRLWQWHALQPRLGLFQGREDEIPFDYDDLLALIAPRPCLIVAPQHDRSADLADVRACIARAESAWQTSATPGALVLKTPDDYNRFQPRQQATFLEWLRSLSTESE